MTTKRRGTRIAESPKKFHQYITTTDNRLQAKEPVSGLTYGKLYVFTDQNIADWNEMQIVRL